MWTNYHTHGDYCDGKEPLSNYLNHPLIASLGFSAHAPLPFECNWSMPAEKLEAYFAEISELKRTAVIEIYAGLEVDYIPKLIGPAYFPQTDFTVGSVHFVDQFRDCIPWEIDGLHSRFTEGLQEIFKGDYKAAWARYFELIRQMLEDSPPDMLGHLDKMKIQNAGNKYFREDEPWYQQEIEKVLNTIKQTETIVEINTRGIYQQKSDTTYPSPWIIAKMKERGIRVTLSSDAHHPKDLCSQFEQAASLLLKTGYKKITVLKDGEWKEVNFNENGIQF